MFFFFFKQKTAYEMRISDWSSDVCSSDLADLIVLVGSNTAWCHPIVYQRIQAARRQRGTTLVVVDPRRTETCEDADLDLAIRPGTDVALMNGLLAHCRDQGLIDEAFLGQRANGRATGKASCRQYRAKSRMFTGVGQLSKK